MDIIENTNQWINNPPTNIIKYLIWAAFILFFIAFLRRLLRKKLPNTEIRYKSQKTVGILGYALLIIVTLSFLRKTSKTLF